MMFSYAILRQANVTAVSLLGYQGCLACRWHENISKRYVKSYTHPKANKLYKKLRTKDFEDNKPLITINHGMKIGELAKKIDKDFDVVRKIVAQISFSTKSARRIREDSRLSIETARQICTTFGFKYMSVKFEGTNDDKDEDKDLYPSAPPRPEDMVRRPAVVTIMGHVDHGKTTLLDALRNTRVVDQEFGGITQHIGAFSVKLDTGETITFLDTPGHAAFSAMRARGANVTDIVVLVVAAEDGVMQQTKESIKFAQEAGVSIIVAINKIDKYNADVERAKAMLMEHGIQAEELGGNVQCIPISALKGTNLDMLKEAIVTEAEILDIKGDPKGPVEGTIIEAKTEPGKGKVCTVLVQRGTLRKHQCIVAGNTWVKIRDIRSDTGRLIKEASPSSAVTVTGWKELPSAGDRILQADSEKQALAVSTYRKKREMDEKMGLDLKEYDARQQIHQEEHTEKRMELLSTGKVKLRKRGYLNETTIENFTGPELTILVKGDVDGSVDALLNILSSYPNQQLKLNIAGFDVGQVTVSDIDLAAPFKGIVYCFNTQKEDNATKQKAASSEVVIKHFNVIYELIDDLKEEITSRLLPTEEVTVVGEAEVLKIFEIKENKKKIAVAGCKCTSGTLSKIKTFRLVRNNEIIHEGSIETMRHLKNEVESIRVGVDCGLAFTDRDVVPQAGDIIKCIETHEVPQQLEWDLNF